MDDLNIFRYFILPLSIVLKLREFSKRFQDSSYRVLFFYKIAILVANTAAAIALFSSNGSINETQKIVQTSSFSLAAIVVFLQASVLLTTPLELRKQRIYYIGPQIFFYLHFIIFYFYVLSPLVIINGETAIMWSVGLRWHLVSTMSWKEYIALKRTYFYT